MAHARIIEYLFFFGILGATAFLMWHIIAPFFSALAIAAVIVTAGYPLYRRILRAMPGGNTSLASILTTVLIALLVLTPLAFLGYLVFSETLALYTQLSRNGGLGVNNSIAQLESFIQSVAPTFSIDVAGYAQQAAGWVAEHIGAIFAGTASTIFLMFLAIIGIFYFFRDGEHFLRTLVRLSPLADAEDTHILEKLARSVRSVVLGTLSVALIQGTLTAVGFAAFGIGHPILWGAVAAIGALVPGIGTSIVFIPAIGFLIFDGSYGAAAGLAAWGVVAVGLIDNLLGPYLMSRGATLHPFFVLLSVLGGIALFGPIGIVLGPVTLSLLTVLIELYGNHVRTEDV